MCTDPAPMRGFTLIELIVAIVVLAAGLAGIMLVFSQTVARSADPMLQQQAMALAEGYLDEILSKNNASNCTADPGSGLTRATWIAVGDYNGLDESPPRDIQGNAIAGLEHYRVQVSTQTKALSGADGCEITVIVTHQTDAGARSVLVGWRMPDE